MGQVELAKLGLMQNHIQFGQMGQETWNIFFQNVPWDQERSRERDQERDQEIKREIKRDRELYIFLLWKGGGLSEVLF